MIVELYKRTNKYFEDIFGRKQETKAINIEIENHCEISIIEHQNGEPLNTPYITVTNKNGSYSMDMDTFIKRISNINQSDIGKY